MLIVVLSKCNIFKRVEQYMFHTVFYYTVQTMLSFRSLLTLPTFSFSASRQGEQSVEFTHEVENNHNSSLTCRSKIQCVLPQSGEYAGCQTKAKELLKYDLLLASFLVQSTGSVEKTFGQEESIPLVPPPIPTHPTVHIRWNLFLFLKKYVSTNVIGFCFPSK